MAQEIAERVAAEAAAHAGLKPYGARLLAFLRLVQIGFKFPFGERRIGEFGRKARTWLRTIRPTRLESRLWETEMADESEFWREDLSK